MAFNSIQWNSLVKKIAQWSIALLLACMHSWLYRLVLALTAAKNTTRPELIIPLARTLTLQRCPSQWLDHLLGTWNGFPLNLYVLFRFYGNDTHTETSIDNTRKLLL